MFNSSLQYDYIFCKEILLRVSCCWASHKGYLRFIKLCERSPIKYMFWIMKTQSMKVFFAACSAPTTSTSAAVNKYLRQSPPFHPYIRLTLNPVWDAFTAIWSRLSHSLQHTHIHTHFTANTVPTQLAWLTLYFIMRHVPMWDIVPDFIYVEQWWLSYLCWSEIAVDHHR